MPTLALGLTQTRLLSPICEMNEFGSELLAEPLLRMSLKVKRTSGLQSTCYEIYWGWQWRWGQEWGERGRAARVVGALSNLVFPPRPQVTEKELY